MSRLFIAEKPSMGRAIAQGLEALGDKSRSADGCIHVGSDTVTWLFGHILEQYSPDEYDEKYKRWHIEDLPIVPSVWKLKVKPDAKKQYKIVSALAKEADEIIHAGDPDREGQLLVDELLAHIGVLKTKPVKRILLNALDVKSVQESLNHILARSAGYDSVVNVGRVKTPTMGLVVRREIEIRTFKPVTFFTPQVEFSHTNGTFRAKWKAQEQDGVDEEGRILKKDLAEEILTAGCRKKKRCRRRQKQRKKCGRIPRLRSQQKRKTRHRQARRTRSSPCRRHCRTYQKSICPRPSSACTAPRPCGWQRETSSYAIAARCRRQATRRAKRTGFPSRSTMVLFSKTKGGRNESRRFHPEDLAEKRDGRLRLFASAIHQSRSRL